VAGGSGTSGCAYDYIDDFEREIGLPAASSLDSSDYEDPRFLMNDMMREEEEMLPGSVGEALQDENLADLVSPEARQVFARKLNLENRVNAVNSMIQDIDCSKNILFAHHGVPNGADLEDYDLDLIQNPGTHVHNKNYGSLEPRRVIEENPESIDAVVGGHFEGQSGQAEIQGVPVFNVAKRWQDLEFENRQELVGADKINTL